MKISFFLVIYTLIAVNAVGQSADQRKKHYNIKKNVAMDGFDPVSYFDGKPTEGSSELKVVYKGLVYQFSSQSNRNKFKENPDKYEPGYGGWCAYAMGETGEKVKIDPETYTILEGRLYLFYNFWGNNTLEDWKKNEKKLKEAGDGNWKKIVQ